MRNTRVVSRKYVTSSAVALLSLVIGTALPHAGEAAGEDLAGLLFRPQALPVASTSFVLSIDVPVLSPAVTAQPGNGIQANAAVSESLPANADGDSAALSASIQALEAEAGPYAPGLAPQLIALARLRQKQRDHAGAIEAASRAAQITRAGFGLDTPEQFPAVELGISSHLALQEFQQALEQQRALLYLHQSFYGPDAYEIVPELVSVGDMYFAAFERGLRRAPIGSDLRMTKGPDSGYADPERLSNEDVAFLWLVQAQNSYVEAIRILLTHADYANPILMNLETSVVETLFLQAHRRELELDPDFFMSVVDKRTRTLRDFDYEATRMRFHGDGERAYQRMLSYQRNAPNVQALQIARTMLQLGDWHVLFGQFRQGRQVYAQTHAFLQANGVQEADMTMLLNPPIPRQLPEFLDQPHSIDALEDAGAADVSFEGYIDVTFTVSQTGSVTGLKVLDSSPNADREIEKRLRKVLRNAPFRPRIGPADARGSDKFELRYSFARL